VRLARAVVVVAAILVACGGGPAGEVEGSFSVGDYELFISCVGTGEPAVVVDVALGDSWENWALIRDRLAAETQVCVYDRAGYGQSDPGLLPRDSLRAARELRDLLAAADRREPYVLVGHGLGASNAQVFAAAYPELTAGLVLLDPPPAFRDAFPELHRQVMVGSRETREQGEAAASSADPEIRASVGYMEMLTSEMRESVNGNVEQVGRIESFGDLPLIVLSSTAPDPDLGDAAEVFQAFWIASNETIGAMSSAGSMQILEGTFHRTMYLEAEDDVVGAISGVVAAISNG
jgi:pimeloyl-ACP methyl ester carboxylesterase